MIEIEKQIDASFKVKIEGQKDVIATEFVVGLTRFMILLSEKGICHETIYAILYAIMSESIEQFDTNVPPTEYNEIDS